MEVYTYLPYSQAELDSSKGHFDWLLSCLQFLSRSFGEVVVA
jgi:hypothetical protein